MPLFHESQWLLLQVQTGSTSACHLSSTVITAVPYSTSNRPARGVHLHARHGKRATTITATESRKSTELDKPPRQPHRSPCERPFDNMLLQQQHAGVGQSRVQPCDRPGARSRSPVDHFSLIVETCSSPRRESDRSVPRVSDLLPCSRFSYFTCISQRQTMEPTDLRQLR